MNSGPCGIYITWERFLRCPGESGGQRGCGTLLGDVCNINYFLQSINRRARRWDQEKTTAYKGKAAAREQAFGDIENIVEATVEELETAFGVMIAF